MSLQDRLDKSEWGVTLVELLLVVAIIALIGATTIPVASGFLVRNYLRNKTIEVATSFRTARTLAMSGKEDSAWGVNISGSAITLFKGPSYAGRDSDFDQSFSIPASISITSDEVVFSKITGNPDATATINVSSNAGDSNSVVVNEVGVVDVN